MRTLIVTDSHIDEGHIPELSNIFEEVYKIKADRLIHLGDFYNNNKITPTELKFGTTVAIELKKLYSDVTILSGNGRHEWLHRSDMVGYLTLLGIKCPGMELIEEIDGKKCFFGHYMTNESYKEYGSHEYTVADLMKYDIVLLGHQHNPQEIRKGKMYHVGSMFYQNFNEASDTGKQIALIEDGELKFIPLTSPIPMKDVHSIEELKKIFTSESPKAKVRLIFSSFAQFKREIGQIKEWKGKFAEFKTKLDFNNTFVAEEPQKAMEKKNTKSLRELMDEELAKIDDKDVRELLENQFEEE